MSLGVEPTTAADPRTELRALAHPTRLRILSLLTGAAMTAADVARELSLTHANASYHLRQLFTAGQIEVAGEERIRGGIAKRYRYVTGRSMPAAAPDPDGEHLADRRAVYLTMAGELRRRSGRLRFAPGRNHVTDAELWVDLATWTEFRDTVMAASVALHRAARPPRTADTIRTSTTVALFEMEPDG
jgi:DNA-binding transcriptional ArsR family regulator